MDKRKRKRETYVRTYKEGGTISVAYGNERIYDHVQRRNTGPAHVQNPLAKRRMQIARAIPSRSDLIMYLPLKRATRMLITWFVLLCLSRPVATSGLLNLGSIPVYLC